jgi:hypothetical protein
MNEKNDRNDHNPEHKLTADIPEDPKWESLEYEQFSPGQPGTTERTVIELQGKPRTRRHARRDGDAPSEPARIGRRGEPSWIAACVAAGLAACVGAAIALAISNPPEHLRAPRTPTSAKPCASSCQPHAQRKRHRRPPRRTRGVVVLTPTRARSDSDVPALPQVPSPHPGANTTPTSAPAHQANTEGQIPRGPFSP